MNFLVFKNSQTINTLTANVVLANTRDASCSIYQFSKNNLTKNRMIHEIHMMYSQENSNLSAANAG